MPRLLTALILTALLAVAGCHTFTESHDQHTVTAPLNDTFTVSLMSNPSTGYQWQVVEYNKKFVEPVGSPKYTPKGSSAGAPGTETFTFRGVAEGKTHIKFEYRRPWEKDVEPARTYDIIADVQ